MKDIQLGKKSRICFVDVNYNIAELYTVFIQTDTTGKHIPAPLAEMAIDSFITILPDPQYKG